MSRLNRARAAFFAVASLWGSACMGPALAQTTQLPATWMNTVNPMANHRGDGFDAYQQIKPPYQIALEDWQDAQSETKAADAFVAFTKNPGAKTRAALQDAIKARTGRMLISHTGEDAIAEFDRRGSFFMYTPDVAERFLARKQGEEARARNKVFRMAMENAKKGISTDTLVAGGGWPGGLANPNAAWTGSATAIGQAGGWPDPFKNR